MKLRQRGSRWSFRHTCAYRAYLRRNSQGIRELMRDMIEIEVPEEIGWFDAMWSAMARWNLLDQWSAEIVRVRLAHRLRHGISRSRNDRRYERSAADLLRRAYELLGSREDLWSGFHPPVFYKLPVGTRAAGGVFDADAAAVAAAGE